MMKSVRPLPTQLLFAALLVSTLGAAACSELATPELASQTSSLRAEIEADEGDHSFENSLYEAPFVEEHITYEASQEFMQLTLAVTGHIPGLFSVEVLYEGADDWVEVAMERPWSEGQLHVMRAIMERPGMAVRIPTEHIVDVLIEVMPEARFERGTAPLIPEFEPPFEYEPPVLDPRVRPISALLPPGTITRDEWGAIASDNACNSPHTPDKMTIHHTAGPNNDSSTAAERLRSIQQHHISGRGWCDIGYHLMVGQDGLLYEARGNLDRPAAHVENQNKDNIGVGMLGNFELIQAPENMVDTLKETVAWLHQTFDIPLDRDAIKGHRERKATACPGALFFPRLEEVVDDAARIVRESEEPDEDVDNGDEDIDEPEDTEGSDDTDEDDVDEDDADEPDADEGDAGVEDDADEDDAVDDEDSSGDTDERDAVDDEDSSDDTPDDNDAGDEDTGGEEPDDEDTGASADDDSGDDPEALGPPPSFSNSQVYGQAAPSTAGCAAAPLKGSQGSAWLGLLFIAGLLFRRRS